MVLVQAIPGVPTLADGLNPATWMLQVRARQCPAQHCRVADPRAINLLFSLARR